MKPSTKTYHTNAYVEMRFQVYLHPFGMWICIIDFIADGPDQGFGASYQSPLDALFWALFNAGKTRELIQHHSRN